MKLRIFLLFLLPALSFQAYSAAEEELSLDKVLRAHLKSVYPQTVRGTHHLDRGEEFNKFSLSAFSITSSEAYKLIRKFRDEPQALSPFYTYLLGRVGVYLEKIEEAYGEEFAEDETYKSVLASIKAERVRILEEQKKEDFFIHVRNFAELYGLLFRALYLADDLSLRKHGVSSREEPIQSYLERLLQRQSGSVFPYGGNNQTPKGEAWKVASSSMFIESLLRSHSEAEVTQEFGHTNFFSRGGKHLEEHLGLRCTTLYCPGAKKLGLTTLVLAALQEHPASLVALPLGKRGLMPAHDVLMSPLDFAAHDYFHALQNQVFFVKIYEWVEQKAQQLVSSGVHYKEAYLVASKIALYRYNKLRHDLLFVLNSLAEKISSKEDQENKLRYNTFLVSVFTLFHEEMFDINEALSEKKSMKRLEKIFAHLAPEVLPSLSEDLFLVDPVTGQSAHSFLATEEDYNFANADFVKLLMKACPRGRPLKEVLAEKLSPVDWEDSSLFKTPFSLEVTLALENGSRITESIILPRGHWGVAAEFNKLLGLLKKEVKAPRLEEGSTEEKIANVNDFLKRVKEAMKQNAEESLQLMKEILSTSEASSGEEEELSAEVKDVIASLARLIGEVEARKTVLSKLEKKVGASKEASTPASLEEGEKEFLLKALEENPKAGRGDHKAFLERVLSLF